jgi:hypothetical protein
LRVDVGRTYDKDKLDDKGGRLEAKSQLDVACSVKFVVGVPLGLVLEPVGFPDLDSAWKRVGRANLLLVI